MSRNPGITSEHPDSFTFNLQKQDLDPIFNPHFPPLSKTASPTTPGSHRDTLFSGCMKLRCVAVCCSVLQCVLHFPERHHPQPMDHIGTPCFFLKYEKQIFVIHILSPEFFLLDKMRSCFTKSGSMLGYSPQKVSDSFGRI